MGDGGQDADPHRLSAEPPDGELERALGQWLRWDQNPKTKAEIVKLQREGKREELRERLCYRMTFGTAGLRSAMGAGFSCINDLTIIQSTQGLLKYLEKCFSDLKQRGVVIGYDTRGQETSKCSSMRLAQLTAAVFLGMDIPVYLFSTYVPTPFVPYAVRQLHVAAGVMITASHNPKQDNGYKVYWQNGAQIGAPHDKKILHCIVENLEPWQNSWNENLCDVSPLRQDPRNEIFALYMEDLKKLCFHRELNRKTALKFVHTSFHGVGHEYVQAAFKSFGFAPPIPVPEQKDPDPEFSTVKCPNPEEGECVLVLAIKLAEKEGARVVLATDPDADRLAVAEEQEDGRWKVFSGNELGALLGWWMFNCWRTEHPDPTDVKNVYMLATTVSSKILQALAINEGFHFEETLPGFKWIGNRIDELLQSGKEVLFAFEESIGFMCGTLMFDKDGVSASAVVAEMAAYLESRGLTLVKQLNNIYRTYGYHITRTSYFKCYDPATIKRIFDRLRNYEREHQYPCLCGSFEILYVRDVTLGFDNSQPNKKSVLPVTRGSQMITFTFLNGCVATLRVSGTEPKVKYYAEFCAPRGYRDTAYLEEELNKLIDALVKNFLEPEKNGLIPRI
ncbi:glucose 1,6-bisphosphate synthase isoform X1 [Narcine bancroftii]|uniref:glucose 1,6-bisphosphate synthase isoform X1 n=1 Tax=Narcine bancroftii TaxID=1343680 RepID=UPI0038322912